MFFIVREGFMSPGELCTLCHVSSRFKDMADGMPRLADVDFSSLTERRIGYENQTDNDKGRVEKTSVAAV